MVLCGVRAIIEHGYVTRIHIHALGYLFCYSSIPGIPLARLERVKDVFWGGQNEAKTVSVRV